MNPVLKDILATGTVKKDGRSIDIQDVSVTLDTGLQLYAFLRKERPARTIEIGLAYGLSALFICQAHRDNGGEGHHTAIDPSESSHWKNVGLSNIERAGFENTFRFFEARSDEALPKLREDGERFDFAFVDGSHLFDNAFIDFFYLDKMLDVGGCIAFDDLWMPAVRKVASFALRNKDYRLVRLGRSRAPRWKQALRIGRRFAQNPLGPDLALKLVPTNVGVLRKIAEKSRPWNYHCPF